jgi:hypothetical protein
MNRYTHGMTRLALLVVSLASTACADVYHLRPNGHDAGDGSSDRPWASLAHAFGKLDAGDTLIVHQGEYALSTRAELKGSGQPGAWIEVRAADGASPVFDALSLKPPTNRETGMGAIHLAGASHVRIEGIGLRNSHGFGIGVFAPSTHVDIVDCTIHTTFAPAIGVWNAKYVRVVGNDVSNANTQDMRIFGSRDRECPHEAISIAGVEFFEVAWNHVHHNDKEGIDVKEVSRHGNVHHNYVHNNDRQGLYADAWFGLLHDVEFISNVVHDCEWGFVVSAEGSKAELRDVHVRHNLLHRNRASGVYFGTWGDDGPRSGVVIEHNTIWSNGKPIHWAGATGSIDLRARNVRDTRIENNLCARGGAFEIATTWSPAEVESVLAERGIVIRGNLIESHKNDNEAPAQYGRPYAFDGQAVIGDPKLIDPESADFRLADDSPAIGAGVGGRDIGALPRGAAKLPVVSSTPIDGQGFRPYTPHRLEGWPAAMTP